MFTPRSGPSQVERLAGTAPTALEAVQVRLAAMESDGRDNRHEMLARPGRLEAALAQHAERASEGQRRLRKLLEL